MKRGTKEGGDPLARVNTKRARVFDPVLDLGATAPIDPIFLGKETKEERPFGSGRDPIIFYIETGERWVDLSDAVFTYKMKIVKGDGGNLTADLPVAPINNFGYANFRWVQAEMNEKKLTDIPDKALAYLQYILTILNFDTIDQTTFLPRRGWYRDTDTQFTATTADNIGFTLRKTLFAQSVTKRVTIPLTSLPFLDFHKAIPPHVQLMLSFHPAATKDVLLGKTDTGGNGNADAEVAAARVEIVDPVIMYSQMVLDPDAEAKMNAMVTKGAFAVNDMDSWAVKFQPLQENLLKNRLDNVYKGILPKRIIIGLQKTTQVQGTITTNPYRFQRHGLERIEIEGDAGYFDLDMRDLNDFEGYETFIKGRKDSGKGIEISFTQWEQDYALYIIDLTPRRDYTDRALSRHCWQSLYRLSLPSRLSPYRDASLVVFSKKQHARRRQLEKHLHRKPVNNGRTR